MQQSKVYLFWLQNVSGGYDYSNPVYLIVGITQQSSFIHVMNPYLSKWWVHGVLLPIRCQVAPFDHMR